MVCILREDIYNYREKKKALLSNFAITFVTQFLMIINSMILIGGITGNFYSKEMLTFIPIIEILALSIPLTPNGMGIREGLLALMFHHVGLTEEQIGTYILIGLLGVLIKLVGIFPVLYRQLLKKKIAV